MQVYLYRRRAAGGVYTGLQLVRDRRELIQSLRRNGGLAIAVRPWTVPRWPGAGMSLRRFTHFSWLLASLIGGGMRVPEALFMLMGEVGGRADVLFIHRLWLRVSAGGGLGVALSAHPGIVPSWYASAVSAAEESSALGEVLQLITAVLQRTDENSRKLRAALFYPMILLAVGTLICLGMLLQIVPRFAELVPEETASQHLVFALSAWLQQLPKGWLLVIPCLFLITFLWRQAIFGLLQLAPPFRGIHGHAARARFCALMYVGLKARRPLIACLQTSSISALPSAQHRAITVVTRAIEQGWALAEAVKAQPTLPRLWAEQIQAAQSDVSVAQAFQRLANHHEAEAEDSMARLNRILEPLLVLSFGSLIGAGILSIYLPVINLGASF